MLRRDRILFLEEVRHTKACTLTSHCGKIVLILFICISHDKFYKDSTLSNGKF